MLALGMRVRRATPVYAGVAYHAAGTRTATNSPRAHSSPPEYSEQVSSVFFSVILVIRARTTTDSAIGVGRR